MIKYFILSRRDEKLCKNGIWEDEKTAIDVAFDGIAPFNTYEEAEGAAKYYVQLFDLIDGSGVIAAGKPKIISVTRADDQTYTLPVYSIETGKVIAKKYSFNSISI